MNLYIQVRDGQPISHPAFEENLFQAFGQIPSDWESFVRVERPSVGVYQVLEAGEPAYQKIGDAWMDVWPLREMTAEEKADKQQRCKDSFNARPQASNWSAWVFDETTCSMQPPIPRPAPDKNKLDQGVRTFWCGAEGGWKDTPAYPQDGKNYSFDFFAWSWSEVA